MFWERDLLPHQVFVKDTTCDPIPTEAQMTKDIYGEIPERPIHATLVNT